MPKVKHKSGSVYISVLNRLCLGMRGGGGSAHLFFPGPEDVVVISVCRKSISHSGCVQLSGVFAVGMGFVN